MDSHNLMVWNGVVVSINYVLGTSRECRLDNFLQSYYAVSTLGHRHDRRLYNVTRRTGTGRLYQLRLGMFTDMAWL